MHWPQGQLQNGPSEVVLELSSVVLEERQAAEHGRVFLRSRSVAIAHEQAFVRTCAERTRKPLRVAVGLGRLLLAWRKAVVVVRAADVDDEPLVDRGVRRSDLNARPGRATVH